jgi:putative Mg2+ transporter-C (MgtC) family protein
MWLAGALGVACGAGYYTLAGIGTVFALIVLIVLARVERALELSRGEAPAEREPPK